MSDSVLGKKRTRNQALDSNNSKDDSSSKTKKPTVTRKKPEVSAEKSASTSARRTSSRVSLKAPQEEAKEQKKTTARRTGKPVEEPVPEPTEPEEPKESTTEKEKKTQKSEEKQEKNEKLKEKPKTKTNLKTTAKRSTQPPPSKRIKPSAEKQEVSWFHKWKEVYMVGTEWENYNEIFKINWDFDHLGTDLLEGFLYESPNKQYLFGCTEGMEITPDPSKPHEKKVTLVPVIVVIDTKLPPPSKLGIVSVQRGEEIIDMKDLKIEWSPLDPTTWRDISPDTKIFKLVCSLRRPQLDRLTVDSKKQYEYALPYIWIPKNDVPKDYDTEVQIVTSIGGRGFNFTFDFKFDEIDEIVQDVLEDEEDQQKYKKELAEEIKRQVQVAKDKIKEDREKAKKQKESLSPAMIESLNNLKCYKYYPQNDHFNIERSSFINRYYGKAEKVFPPPKELADFSYLKPIESIAHTDATDQKSDVTDQTSNATDQKSDTTDTNAMTDDSHDKQSDIQEKNDDVKDKQSKSSNAKNTKPAPKEKKDEPKKSSNTKEKKTVTKAKKGANTKGKKSDSTKEKDDEMEIDNEPEQSELASTKTTKKPRKPTAKKNR